MRRDFTDIYLYAKRKGLLVSIFTNATMLTAEMVDFLAEYRPFNLEITLYGWTKETFERVTGVPGSHRRCYAALELLASARHPVPPEDRADKSQRARVPRDAGIRRADGGQLPL